MGKPCSWVELHPLNAPRTKTSRRSENMLRAFFGAVITLAICAPMFAHHGASAYDRGATVTLKATITEFKYANPHVQIFFDAKDDKGNVQHWNCETIIPAMLSKQGWSNYERRSFATVSDVVLGEFFLTLTGRFLT